MWCNSAVCEHIVEEMIEMKQKRGKCVVFQRQTDLAGVARFFESGSAATALEKSD